ncbi:hypothetical protein Tcan_11574 [Toxocara canis]|uniref:Pepsin inhibitor-3-like repeated domain-containing protein n=1 Tax=Toxocara canis TaxID=6265 RepID=A0A0B2VYL6_TOXCA|nr:hypothetical protein Tcan_11574 [Toxocara canis]
MALCFGNHAVLGALLLSFAMAMCVASPQYWPYGGNYWNCSTTYPYIGSIFGGCNSSSWYGYYDLSPNCVVRNGIVYVDGFPRGQLTSQQQHQLQEFLHQRSMWDSALNYLIQQELQRLMSTSFKQTSTPSTYSFSSRLPPCPQLPSFCKRA